MLLASLSDVFIVGSNAFGPTMQGCWLPTPFTSFPFTSPPVRRRVPSGSERAIQQPLSVAVHELWWTRVKCSSNHNAEYNHKQSQQWTKFHDRHEQQHKKTTTFGTWWGHMYNNNQHTVDHEEKLSGHCLQFHQQNSDMPWTTNNQLDQSCQKRWSITQSQGGHKHSLYSETKEG